MSVFRHYLALLAVLMVPSSVLMWLVIHPFVAFWRRLGPGWTYTFAIAASWAGVAGLFAIRRPLLAVDFGTCWFSLVVGAAALAVAGCLRVRLHRHFSNSQLLGLPELAPARFPQRLVTEGLHARVRHPRYLQFLLALGGWALVANYLASYVLLALAAIGIWFVVVLEEKELRDRFGAAYEEYCRGVPRFIPRWRGRD